MYRVHIVGTSGARLDRRNHHDFCWICCRAPGQTILIIGSSGLTYHVTSRQNNGPSIACGKILDLLQITNCLARDLWTEVGDGYRAVPILDPCTGLINNLARQHQQSFYIDKGSYRTTKVGERKHIS